MQAPDIDYGSVLAALGDDRRPPALGEALLSAVWERYADRHGDAFLQVFEQGGATYLFDMAGALGLPQEDRTVAAWATAPQQVPNRDTAYQRGFPMAPGDGPAVDRGHLVPHLSGGQFGPNIFRQDRALNRGWSAQGKRYRALEREAATPGAFFFGRLLYDDDTAYPAWLEIGVLRGQELVVERFDNRPASQATD